MVATRRTGCTEHETVEIMPTVLDCGHPFAPGRVTIGYQPDPAGVRRRAYRCNTCRHISWG